uniref:Gastrotropin isoform X1 n=1 Tax=Geotrypetes seraphini TaxID=260995 RepID=A0A6P8PGC4_GEOSA|nr:gastrotropin isoform X1 [Geotrypetes seraphini]
MSKGVEKLHLYSLLTSSADAKSHSYTVLTNGLKTSRRETTSTTNAACAALGCKCKSQDCPQTLPSETGSVNTSGYINCLPSDVIEKGKTFIFVTEVVQNGKEFTWSQVYPGGHTMTNKFIIDQECEMETMAGKKFKATVRMDGGKVVVDFPKYHHSSEIVGNKLVETSVAGGITFKRISKRIA